MENNKKTIPLWTCNLIMMAAFILGIAIAAVFFIVSHVPDRDIPTPQFKYNSNMSIVLVEAEGTGSMLPLIDKGTTSVATPDFTEDDLSIGDMILFEANVTIEEGYNVDYDTPQYILHRIINIELNKEGEKVFITQGDNAGVGFGVERNTMDNIKLVSVGFLYVPNVTSVEITLEGDSEYEPQMVSDTWEIDATNNITRRVQK